MPTDGWKEIVNLWLGSEIREKNLRHLRIVTCGAPALSKVEGYAHL